MYRADWLGFRALGVFRSSRGDSSGLRHRAAEWRRVEETGPVVVQHLCLDVLSVRQAKSQRRPGFWLEHLEAPSTENGDTPGLVTPGEGCQGLNGL